MRRSKASGAVARPLLFVALFAGASASYAQLLSVGDREPGRGEPSLVIRQVGPLSVEGRDNFILEDLQAEVFGEVCILRSMDFESKLVVSLLGASPVRHLRGQTPSLQLWRRNPILGPRRYG